MDLFLGLCFLYLFYHVSQFSFLLKKKSLKGGVHTRSLYLLKYSFVEIDCFLFLIKSFYVLIGALFVISWKSE